MIYIEPLGGLCNRMRAINSALQIANKTNQQLTIIWRENQELNCPYNALFQINNRVKVITVKSFIEKIRSKIIYYSCEEQYEDAVVLKLRDEQKRISPSLYQNYKNIYFKTGQQFETLSDFDFFKPNSHIVDRVSQIRERFGKQSIGIHIRRTDNSLAIQNSSLESFATAIEKELEKNSETTFFLATDDADVEADFKNNFGHHIIVQDNKQINRNSKKAIEDAYVDLLCLASTQKIYGSFYSSFSEVSAAIGKIPLIIISTDGGVK